MFRPHLPENHSLQVLGRYEINTSSSTKQNLAFSGISGGQRQRVLIAMALTRDQGTLPALRTHELDQTQECHLHVWSQSSLYQQERQVLLP